MDSILHKKLSEIDTTTKEVIKYVYIERDNINEVKEEQVESQKEESPRIKPMIPRGIVYSTYIIAENEDGMYIIDQHAAAERINYEKVLKSLKKF